MFLILNEGSSKTDWIVLGLWLLGIVALLTGLWFYNSRGSEK